MSPNLSEGLLSKVEAVLPSLYGVTPMEAHRRVGLWSLATIRQALFELVAAGRVTSEGPAGFRTYRRAVVATFAPERDDRPRSGDTP